MDIKLNFINNSNDTNNSSVVIFQKNVATNFDETAVAWKAIENCGVGDNHPFTYPLSSHVSASDSWGNYTPKLAAQNGNLFHVALSSSGTQLSLAGDATNQAQIHVANELPKGAVNASIYKDGTLLATHTSIAPGQKAAFEFKPTIWIGVASQVVQGQVMNSAIISNVNTELSLLGIAEADIIMTGGGPGGNSAAFVFHLENIVFA
ncbi:MAG: hypothetical protein HYR68_01730 [Burkholderiales bacterium]|nr:hypothetical protein [Burkholderiales bacterium]MBI3730133.1 hypothetical protein [Burkholderiales bacterium]